MCENTIEGRSELNGKTIFISWSGRASKTLAEALRHWLPLVLQGSRPWMSSTDIQSGERWFGSITEMLQQSTFGIICVTPDNLHSDWLNYESGAIAKEILDSNRVCPLLIGLSPSELEHHPLTHFQCQVLGDDPSTNERSVRALVWSLNDSLAEFGIHPSLLERTFHKWWPDFENVIARALKLVQLAQKDPLITHNDWTAGESRIKRAKNKIVLISSFVHNDDAFIAELATLARSAEVNGYKVDVDIYLCDPQKSTGANRLIDSKRATKKKDAKKEFQERFERNLKTFGGLVSDHLRISIRVYDFSPVLKVLEIDDTIFWSWMPLNEAAIRRICFELPSDSASDSGQYVREEVEHYVEQIREHSRAIEFKYHRETG